MNLMKKKGFSAYLIQVAKGSLVAPLVAVPTLMVLDTSRFSLTSMLLYIVVFYFIGFISLLVIQTIEFWGRSDDYIFRSDFLVIVFDLSLSEVKDLFIFQGYSSDESSSNSEVLTKEILFEAGIGARIVEKHKWSVALRSNPGSVSVYFFTDGVESFDGRQIAYKAALDFTNKLDADVKRKFGIMGEDFQDT